MKIITVHISMLFDFKHLQCDVLSKLIGVYCLDVYGSQLWDYESGRAEVDAYK